MALSEKFYVTENGVYLGSFVGARPEGGIEVPYAPSHASQVWDAENQSWGVAPSEVLGDLSPKEFWRGALNIGITEDTLIADIGGLDLTEDEKEDLRIAVRKSTSFVRTDPDLIFMLNAKGFDASQIDTLWLWVLQSRQPETDAA